MKYVRMRKIIIDPNEFMIAGMTNEYVEIILDVIEWKVAWQEFKDGKERNMPSMR